MGPFFGKKSGIFGQFFLGFRDHKIGLQVSRRGVGKRLIAQNAAEIYPMGGLVQLREASGVIFGDTGLALPKTDELIE